MQDAPPKRHRSRRDLCDEVRLGSRKIRLNCQKNYTIFAAYEAAFGARQTVPATGLATSLLDEQLCVVVGGRLLPDECPKRRGGIIAERLVPSTLLKK